MEVMVYTDPRLKEAAKSSPESEVQLVLGCAHYTEALKARLAMVGFSVEDEQSADIGVISGRARLAKLRQIEAIEEITSIEPNENAQIF